MRCGLRRERRRGADGVASRARRRSGGRRLRVRGADVDVVNDDGYTPLHIAAMEGKPEIVAPLVNAGARLRARTRKNAGASFAR